MNSLTDIDFASVTRVCINMRADDAVEIYGLRPHDNPIMLAYEVMAVIRNGGRGCAAWHEGKPVAIVGFAENWPGVWQVILFATPEFRAVARPVLRWIRDTAADLVENHGGRRLQCDSRFDHEDAHRFLRAVGAHPEGPPMRDYGKDGAAYQRFVWRAGVNDFFIASKKGTADVLRINPSSAASERPANGP